MHLPSYSSVRGGTSLHQKLEAALILRGVVRLKLDDQEIEILPRTWYQESGERYLEARRRDSGEYLRLRVSDIRDVLAF
jgi:hypothetical protein